jgi:outer membrane protein assembly factor BamB
MKEIVLVVVICLSIFSCDLFGEKDEKKNEPPYKAKIEWASGLISNYYFLHTVDADSVYFYERTPGYDDARISNLTRLDTENGRLIWRSNFIFSGMFSLLDCQPIVTDDYIYVFCYVNRIACFDRETGNHTATVEVDVENHSKRIMENVTAYERHIYFGFDGNENNCFGRINMDEIRHGDPETKQTLAPEVIWSPQHGFVRANPVMHNNTMYTATTSSYYPIELAGFDLDTLQTVFHRTFGGPEDDDYFFEQGGRQYPILIYGDILYYLGWTISAWDLKTERPLNNVELPIYRHIFTQDIPKPLNYSPGAGVFLPVYYQGKIYYTCGSSYVLDGRRNIQCIDAETGKLVWNDIAKNSTSLVANLVIAHDRLYVTQNSGLRVYNPEDGKLIGVDKSFYGEEHSRNVLYNDYMICVRKNRKSGDEEMVAVYVGSK